MPAVFRQLAEGRLTGLLRLTRERAIKAIFFESGAPVFAVSSLPEEQPHRKLLDDGLVTPEQVDAARGLNANLQQLSRTLVEMRVLREPMMQTSMRELALKIIQSTFEWDSGEYVFSQNLAATHEVKLESTAADCITTAARLAATNEAVLDRVAPVDLVVEPTDPSVNEVGRLAKLSPVEGYVLSCVTAPTLVGDTSSLTGLPDIETRRGIFVLIELGLLKSVRDLALSAAPATAPISFSSSVPSVSSPTVPERPGSERLGSERPGSERLGSERLGSERLGSERLGSERRGSETLSTGKSRETAPDPVWSSEPGLDDLDSSMGEEDDSGQSPGESLWAIEMPALDAVTTAADRLWMDEIGGRDSAGDGNLYDQVDYAGQEPAAAWPFPQNPEAEGTAHRETARVGFQQSRSDFEPNGGDRFGTEHLESGPLREAFVASSTSPLRTPEPEDAFDFGGQSGATAPVSQTQAPQTQASQTQAPQTPEPRPPVSETPAPSRDGSTGYRYSRRAATPRESFRGSEPKTSTQSLGSPAGQAGGDEPPARLLEEITEKLNKVANTDFYGVLGVNKLSSNGSIQKAHADLIKQYNPIGKCFSNNRELTSKLSALVARINEAYQTLGNPEKRRVYDMPKNPQAMAPLPNVERGRPDSLPPSLPSSPSRPNTVQLDLTPRPGQVAPRPAAASPPAPKQPGSANPFEAADHYFRQGRVYYQRNDFHTAAHMLRQAVNLDPNRASYHYYLGLTLSVLSQARSIHAHHEGCHVNCNHGGSLTRNQRVRHEAEQHLHKAGELDPTNADIKIRLGLLYKEAGLAKKAEQFFHEALLLDASSDIARIELGLQDEGDSDRSRRSGSSTSKS